MDQYDAVPGLEVINRDYGRGVLLEAKTRTNTEMASASVYFYYPAETETVPLYSLREAKEELSLQVNEGNFGFEIEIHDGMFTFYIKPDGEGTGYDVSLVAGNAQLGEQHFSTEEII